MTDEAFSIVIRGGTVVLPQGVARADIGHHPPEMIFALPKRDASKASATSNVAGDA